MDKTVITFSCFLGWFIFLFLCLQLDPEEGGSAEQNAAELMPVVAGVTVISVILIYFVHWIIFCIAAFIFITTVLLVLAGVFENKKRSSFAQPVNHINYPPPPPLNPPQVNTPLPARPAQNVLPPPLPIETNSNEVPDILYKGVILYDIALDIYANQRFRFNPSFKPYGVWCCSDLLKAKGYAEETGFIVEIDVSLIKHLTIEAFEVARLPEYKEWIKKYGDSGGAYSSFVLGQLNKKLIHVNESVYVIAGYYNTGYEYHRFDYLKVTRILNRYGLPIL